MFLKAGMWRGGSRGGSRGGGVPQKTRMTIGVDISVGTTNY